VTDKDGNDVKSRMTVVGILAAIIVFFFVVVPMLPFEAPYFPAADSEYRAYRLFREGDCAGGYAIFEKRAEKEKGRSVSGVSYLMFGRMKEKGFCGSPDIPGAIEAYRKAAAMGSCRANFELGRIKFSYPNIPNLTQIDYPDNFFAAIICASVIEDHDLLSWYFDDGTEYATNERLRTAFHEALARRNEFKKLSPEQQRKIRNDIVTGNGFDANSHARH